MISRWLMLRALWGQLVFQYLGADEERMRKFRESVLRITGVGTRTDDPRASSATPSIEVIEPIVYDEALDLIRDAPDGGPQGLHHLGVTGGDRRTRSPSYLGVDEAIATRAALDDEGRYTGEVEFLRRTVRTRPRPCARSANRDGIDLDRSYAYSDSATDLPMLEVVGHPVVVNPDRELARVARERDWRSAVPHRRAAAGAGADAARTAPGRRGGRGGAAVAADRAGGGRRGGGRRRVLPAGAAGQRRVRG